MLEALRRGVRSWLVQILLGLLVISFALWGVADVFRGYGQNALARVGKTEITSESFQQALQTEISLMSRQFGRRLTTEQARQFGIDQRVLSRLIGTAALDTHAKQLGLTLPDSAIAEAIRTDPAFQGVGGFNREQFVELLRQNGLTEQRYFAERRATEVRDQLIETVGAPAPVPDIMLDLQHRFREETRKVAYLTLDPEKSAKVEAPDEAKLKEYYEQNKRQFVAPEYRKVPVLLLTRADVAKRITVSDDDVKAYYDQNKSTFEVPERRKIQQLSFPDKAAAEKARAELVKATTFEEGLKALGVKDSDVELGSLARSELIDPKIAEAAFMLEKDKLSEPVVGGFTTVLLRVSEITPGKISTLDEVKQQIRDRLASERAGREIQEIHDRIDDDRAGGKSLREVGEAHKVKFVEVDATDRQGRAPDGKPALEHPEAARILATAFQGVGGVDREALELTDGGYAWVDIAGVTPERQKPFDEVKDDVKKTWEEAERRKALTTSAQAIVDRMAKGDKLADVAKELGVPMITSTAFKRGQQMPGLSPAAIQQAFSLAKGKATSVQSADSKSRTILVLDEIIPAPPATKEQTDRMRTELQRQLQTDVIAGYVNGLQTQLGFSVNEQVYRRALGLDRQ